MHQTILIHYKIYKIQMRVHQEDQFCFENCLDCYGLAMMILINLLSDQVRDRSTLIFLSKLGENIPASHSFIRSIIYYLSRPLATSSQPVSGKGDLCLAARGQGHHHHQESQGNLQGAKSGRKNRKKAAKAEVNIYPK